MKQFEFGPFQLHEESVKLTKDDAEIKLEPLVFDVLLYLVRNQNKVVTKDEMLNQLWGGRVLSNHVITRIIYQLRKVLNDHDPSNNYIRTVRGKGYQFVTPITLSLNASPQTPQPGSAKATLWKAITKMSYWGLLGVVMLFLMIGWFLLKIGQSNNHAGDELMFDNQSNYQILTILPIAVSSDTDELSILVMSLIDYLTYQLVNHFNMKVVHPDSLSHEDKQNNDIYAIQRSTNANYLIEGFIESNLGEQINLRLNLYKMNPNGSMEVFPLGAFGFSYPHNSQDLKEFYRARKITARSILEIIKPGLTLSSDRDFETLDPEAYRLVIAAHHIARSDDCDDIQRAEQLLLQAIERDDQFVYAYLKLFNNYYQRIWICGDSTDYHAKGLAMARMIDQLAPNKYQAVAVRKSTILVESNQVELAFDFSQHADWNDPRALYDMSYSLRYAGFLNRSAVNIDRILQLDPLFFSEKPILHAPNTLLYLNRFEDHLKLLAEPGNSYHDYFRGLNLLLSGKPSAARQILQPVVKRTPEDLFGLFAMGLIHIIDEEYEAAKQVVEGIIKQREDNHHTDGEMTYKLAQLFALAGYDELALKHFQLAVDQGFFPVSYFLRDPAMRSIMASDSFHKTVEQAANRHRAFAQKYGLPIELDASSGGLE